MNEFKNEIEKVPLALSTSKTSLPDYCVEQLEIPTNRKINLKLEYLEDKNKFKDSFIESTIDQPKELNSNLERKVREAINKPNNFQSDKSFEEPDESYKVRLNVDSPYENEEWNTREPSPPLENRDEGYPSGTPGKYVAIDEPYTYAESEAEPFGFPSSRSPLASGNTKEEYGKSFNRDPNYDEFEPNIKKEHSNHYGFRRDVKEQYDNDQDDQDDIESVNEEEIKKKKEEERSDILWMLKKLKKVCENPEEYPQFDEYTPTVELEKILREVRRETLLNEHVSYTKQMLAFGWSSIECIATQYLSIDLSGFTAHEAKNIKDYNRILLEIGERDYLSWSENLPPELRLLFMTLQHAFIFSVMKKNPKGMADVTNFFSTPNTQSGEMKGPSKIFKT
uniref:Uncharacterized protein n=1 Tax=viral metagenome TaxID=1070528 RepID=A0A6C0JSF1_9ZZZZ